VKLIIGILDADVITHPRLKSQYIAESRMLQTLLKTACQNIQFKIYAVTDCEYPQHMDECDVYLITGSESSVYDAAPWILILKKYVQSLYQQGKKLLGICFGHQLIAHVLGGETRRSGHGWGVGVHTYNSTRAGQLLSLPREFSLLVSHQDQVHSLPPNATLMASSAFCPVAAYRIKHQVLCFQGHPEFVVHYAQTLLSYHEIPLPRDTVQQAELSFNLPIHHQQVARAMLSFVGANMA